MSVYVSIIMPCFNAAHDLAESIGSIQRQSHKDWELIVVDDGSTDNTPKVLNHYAAHDDRIKPLFLTRAQGGNAGKARNAGVAVAKGRYIAFLDADDCWYPNKLKAQLEFMNEKGASISTTYTDIIDGDGHIVGHYRPKLAVAGWKEMLAENLVTMSAAMIDTKVHSGVRMPDMARCEDYALWMGLVREGAWIHIMPEALTQYRIQHESFFKKKPREAYYRWLVYREYLELDLLPTLHAMMRYAFAGFSKVASYLARSGNS